MLRSRFVACSDNLHLEIKPAPTVKFIVSLLKQIVLSGNSKATEQFDTNQTLRIQNVRGLAYLLNNLPSCQCDNHEENTYFCTTKEYIVSSSENVYSSLFYIFLNYSNLLRRMRKFTCINVTLRCKNSVIIKFRHIMQHFEEPIIHSFHLVLLSKTRAYLGRTP